MRNKSKSRKRKEKAMLDFLIAITKVIVASKVAAQKIREIKYPKFANGGIAWENKPIEKQKGREYDMHVEAILPEIIIKNPRTVEEAHIAFLSGRECIVPVKSKGGTPSDNDKYMFQDY